MKAETWIMWGCLNLGTALAMALVFDRDRLFCWMPVQGLFWVVYILYSLCVR